MLSLFNGSQEAWKRGRSNFWLATRTIPLDPLETIRFLVITVVLHATRVRILRDVIPLTSGNKSGCEQALFSTDQKLVETNVYVRYVNVQRFSREREREMIGFPRGKKKKKRSSLAGRFAAIIPPSVFRLHRSLRKTKKYIFPRTKQTSMRVVPPEDVEQWFDHTRRRDWKLQVRGW